MKHTFYSDPGHGWLAVPRQELINLGVLHKISRYSYQRKDMVYLEEDCDVSRYAQALKAEGKPFEYREAKPANQCSKIRSYFPFSCTTDEAIQSIMNWNTRIHQATDELLNNH